MGFQLKKKNNIISKPKDDLKRQNFKAVRSTNKRTIRDSFFSGRVE